MEAKELRIGNLIYKEIPSIDTTKEIVEVLSIDDSFDVLDVKNSGGYITEECSLDIFQPIPLTEECLVKFGFEERLGGRFFKHTWFYIDQDCAGVSGWYFRSIDGFKAKCEYIHQLQNLYFALTGEELNKQY